MSDTVIVRHRGDGKTVLVGGADYVTYMVRSAETDGALRTVLGRPGTAVSVAADVAHTFRNAGDSPGRLLFVHMPAALEEFFEEYGVPVNRHGDVPDDLAPPDFGAMAAALERNGVRVVASPAAIQES